MKQNYNMDSIFQQKINGLEMPFQAADWTLMDEMLENSFVEGAGNMTDNSTEAEKIIAEKIEGHSMEMMPEDWQMFAQTLQETNFDNLVANSLLQHEITMPQSDWADFEQDLVTQNFDNQFQTLQTHEMPLEMGAWDELDADLTAAPFESIFAEKLNNLTQKPSQKDWVEMASKLDQASFDAAVAKQLQTHQMAFAPEDWKLMEALLDEKEKKPLVAFWDWRKWAILGSLLLGGGAAFWSWNGFDGKELPKAVMGETKPYEKEVKSNAEPLPKSQAIENEKDNLPKEENLNKKEAETIKVESNFHSKEKGQNNRPKSLENDKLGISHTNKKENSQHEKAAKMENIFQNVPPVVSPLNENAKENAPSERNIPILEKTKVAPIPTKNALHKAEILAENKLQSIDNKEVENNTSIIKTKQNALEIHSIVGVSPLIAQNLRTDVWIPISEKKQISSQVSLGLYASPLQSVAELNSKGKNGFATGLRMEVGTEKWSFVTGALYADKQFETRYWKYSAKLQHNYEHLLKAHVQEIGLPFLYKRNFDLVKGFSIYGQGGWIPIVTIKENYEHADPTNPSNTGISDLSRMVMEKQEQFYHAYLGYAQVSPGVQYRYKHLSVFAEPYFQWGIQRMSMEEKRMHSYGLGFGVLYKIGK